MPELPEGTNVLGVGTDLIEVDRIRSSIESHADRFIEKVFTSIGLLISPLALRPRRPFPRRFEPASGPSSAGRTPELRMAPPANL